MAKRPFISCDTRFSDPAGFLESMGPSTGLPIMASRLANVLAFSDNLSNHSRGWLVISLEACIRALASKGEKRERLRLAALGHMRDAIETMRES